MTQTTALRNIAATKIDIATNLRPVHSQLTNNFPCVASGVSLNTPRPTRRACENSDFRLHPPLAATAEARRPRSAPHLKPDTHFSLLLYRRVIRAGSRWRRPKSKFYCGRKGEQLEPPAVTGGCRLTLPSDRGQGCGREGD